jgi:ATP-grasp domain
LTFVSGLRRVYPYRGLYPARSLRNALFACQPDVVVPCDDGVVAQLHALHALEPSLRPLIERSLGAPENFSLIENRYLFLSAAIDLGIRVPKTRRVATVDDLVAWHVEFGSSAVLKVDGESGGNGVKISYSLDESIAAWRELQMPCSSMTAWKRLVIDRDPLALWRRAKRGREVTIQEFIPGRPANSMFACWGGQLLAIVSVAVVASEGPTGAAIIVRVIKDEQVTKAAERVASKLKLSGFFGMDFILDSRTGTPYLIEMNPRCTQLGHIEFFDQGSLAGAFSAVLRGELLPPSIQKSAQIHQIALFPQALAAGEIFRPYVDSSYHDVPSEEPKLQAELMLKVWPHRRWAARLYHAFRPVNRAVPILFEDLDSNSMSAN